MNIEHAKEIIRSYRYNGTHSSSPRQPSSGALCEEMPSFAQYVLKRKANRISSSKIKTLIGATRSGRTQERYRVLRIARDGYSRATLIQMYGIDGEVICKRWLKEVLGWQVIDEITRTSATDPRLCGKADGRLCLQGEQHLVEIKCTIHQADTSRFPLEDLPQLQANMVCAGIRKTIYVRWNRILCCAWLVEFDERYWRQFLLPEIRLGMSSPGEDENERRRSFLNESRFSGPPRKLLFLARKQGIMWYHPSYMPTTTSGERTRESVRPEEEANKNTKGRRGTPSIPRREITLIEEEVDACETSHPKVILVSKYFTKN